MIMTLKVCSKTCVKRPLSKRRKIGFQDQLSLNAGQKYCRMPQGEHSAILLTFIKLPFANKTFVLSIFEWPFYTGITEYQRCRIKGLSQYQFNLLRLESPNLYSILAILYTIGFCCKVKDRIKALEICF